MKTKTEQNVHANLTQLYTSMTICTYDRHTDKGITNIDSGTGNDNGRRPASGFQLLAIIL